MGKATFLLTLSLIFSFLLCRETAYAQKSVNMERIEKLYASLNSNFKEKESGLYFETNTPSDDENSHSWLWPLCALIQATNEMEQLNPEVKYMEPVQKAIDQYFNPKKPNPAFQDYVLNERLSSKFYDDNQWIAIAYLDAYQRTHEKKYLKTAKLIYDFQTTGIDTVAGGGCYWKAGDKSTKNTCSNGPGILVALQLYKITHKRKYLKTALSLYNWTNKNLQSPEGVFYDAIQLPSKKINKATYTYNTGTMLQANALLYKITNENKYLKEAQRIAVAGKKHFFKNNRLPKEYWFNAVMLRGYVELFKIDKNQTWLNFFRTDINGIWNDERNAENIIGTKDEKKLIDQAAVIEILAVLEQANLIKNK